MLDTVMLSWHIVRRNWMVYRKDFIANVSPTFTEPSGTFFPVTQMPIAGQYVAKALPLYHGVQLSQALFWDQDVVNKFALHGPVLLLYSAVLLTVARIRLRKKLQA